MGNTKSQWSYSTGERGRNRVNTFEHSSGVLMLEFYERQRGTNARRVRLSLGHRDRTKAKQQADEAAAKLGKAEALKPEELTLRELFDIYGREKTPTKGKSKRDHDCRASKMFLGFLGAVRVVSTLSERDWSRFVQERRTGKTGPTKQPVGDRQVAYDLKFLLSVLNWATKAGDGRGGFLLHENPLKGCPLPKEKSPRRPLLYDEEYSALRRVAGDVGWRFRVALILAHETGHRIGAIRLLRWSDVDLQRQTVRWRKSNDKIGMEHETWLTG